MFEDISEMMIRKRIDSISTETHKLTKETGESLMSICSVLLAKIAHMQLQIEELSKGE